MKYFFLAEGWTYNRVWELGGIWNRGFWGRSPEITQLNCGIVQQEETLWLYQVEDAVIMIEVQPISLELKPDIGQVVLKRLINAEEVLQKLHDSQNLVKNHRSQERSSK